MPIDLEFHFQNYKHFLKYFQLFILTTVNTKNDTRNFCLFVYLRSYNDKIFVFRNSAVKSQHVLFENEPYLRKMLISFFSSDIPLYIVKNPVEELCKVLEMELKKRTPRLIWNSFLKNFLHYIQHDFIRQRPGLSKDQISIFKSLVSNYFILKYRLTF